MQEVFEFIILVFCFVAAIAVVAWLIRNDSKNTKTKK